MPGLSYLQEGGQPEQQARPTIQLKPSAGRGPIQYPTVSGTIPAGASTLEAMEEMYQEMLGRQTGMRGFLEAAKDAQAWWTPGGAQRAQALEGRTQARERQAAELFNMRSQIAQYKSALEAREAFNKQRKDMLEGGVGAGGAPGQGAAGAMFGLDPAMKQALSAPNLSEADYNKLYAEWAKKQAEIWASPEMDKPTGKKYVEFNKERNDWVLTEPTVREIRMNPGRYYNLDGTPAVPTAPAQGAPTAPARAAPVAPVSGNLTAADMQIPSAAPEGVSVAPKNFTFDELTPEQKAAAKAITVNGLGLFKDFMDRPDAAEIFNSKPIEARQKLFNLVSPEQPSQVAAVPAPSVGSMTPPVQVAQAPAAARPPKPTAAEMERQAEVRQARDLEIAKGEGAAVSARENRTISEGQKADINIREFDKMIDLLKETPNMTGLAQVPGISSSLIAVTKDGGVTFPIMGTLRAPELEEAAARSTMSAKELANRSMFDTLAKRAGLAYRKEVYEGTGQVSDSETRIAEFANGLSKESPFRANLMFAVLHKERQQLNKDRYDGWIKFKQANPSKNFSDYEQTDYYRVGSIEAMDKRIQSAFPGFFKDAKDMKPLSSFSRKTSK